jgi:hypothetical protein
MRSPRNNYKSLIPSVPEINTVSNNILMHTSSTESERSVLDLMSLLREWDLYWSGHDEEDVKLHLNQMWLRERFPKSWADLPLADSPPRLVASGMYPAEEDTIKEWKRYYGCDENGNVLPNIDT